MIIGIDPGKHGAIAILFNKDTLVVQDLDRFYDECGAARSSINPVRFTGWLQIMLGRLRCPVFCEAPVFVGGGFTAHTTMSMFESFGVLRSVFLLHGFPFVSVKPMVWIRSYTELYHPRVKREKKESVILAERLFPRWRSLFYKKKKSGKGADMMLDGRAEAVLIANYGYHKKKEITDNVEKEVIKTKKRKKKK